MKHDAPMLTVRILPRSDASGPEGRLAEAELHFHEGPLAGLKLIGFAVWEGRARNSGRRHVTFPARSITVNGERRSFALLRPTTADRVGHETVCALILKAYATYDASLVEARG